jgi:hypothetical protein
VNSDFTSAAVTKNSKEEKKTAGKTENKKGHSSTNVEVLKEDE